MGKRDKMQNKVSDEFSYTILASNKEVKVIKGGRRMRFFALVVAGNKKGVIGFGTGKDVEIQTSIDKAKRAAIKNKIKIPIVNETIPHEVKGE